MCLTRSISLCNFAFIFFLVLFNCYIDVLAKGEKCIECRFLVETFNEGLNRTSKSHFGGGNTAWEERKLGKFITSEIRFTEIMEYVCKKDVLSNSYEYDTKDIQFKCHTLAEDVEESLEKWFFELQSTQPDLQAHLCVEQLKRCCPAGHFGPVCTACPGFFQPDSVEDSSDEESKKPRECFGRGRCDGSGTREGTGKCDCNSGYTGKMCSNCAAHYFPLAQSENSIECEECFDGCASGCTASGPKGCNECRTGYEMDEQMGCKDIDECAASTDNSERKCAKEHEKCVNTPGSYRCECEDGYKSVSSGDDARCELDVEEPSKEDENNDNDDDEATDEVEKMLEDLKIPPPPEDLPVEFESRKIVDEDKRQCGGGNEAEGQCSLNSPTSTKSANLNEENTSTLKHSEL